MQLPTSPLDFTLKYESDNKKHEIAGKATPASIDSDRWGTSLTLHLGQYTLTEKENKVTRQVEHKASVETSWEYPPFNEINDARMAAGVPIDAQVAFAQSADGTYWIEFTWMDEV